MEELCKWRDASWVTGFKLLICIFLGIYHLAVCHIEESFADFAVTFHETCSKNTMLSQLSPLKLVLKSSDCMSELCLGIHLLCTKYSMQNRET